MRLDPYDALERLLAWLVGVCLLALLILSGLATRLDNLFYDVHLRHWQYAPDDDVVIVAIDPRSVAALGAWPWSRRLHAQLLDRLTAAGVRGVGLDVTVSEPSANDPAGDQVLADAIRRNGRVVMPIFAEPDNLGGQLEEMPPIPPIATAAAAIGQVEVPLDADGMARGMYLHAGIGRPYWPSMALAVYQLGRPAPLAPAALPGLRDLAPATDQPYMWVRDNHVLLRYAGPGGSFGRVSYVDVLRGDTPAALLKGRWVLIGATGTGLGDNIPTPASASQPTMPGVEYQANALESLAHGRLVTPMDFSAQFGLGALVLALPALLSLLPGLRRGWLAALLAMLGAAALSIALLRGAGAWWPPAAACLVIVLALAAWGAARLYRYGRQPGTAARLRLAGRRRFRQVLAQETHNLRGEARPLSLLLVGVGNLDGHAARYGRQARMEALQVVAGAVARQAIRSRDVAGRYREHVFALLLPRCPHERARQIAQALREELMAQPLPWPGTGMAAPLQLELGVASLVPTADDDDKALLAQALEALRRNDFQPPALPSPSAAADSGEPGRQRVEESLR